jgi:hypothetical protein
MRGFLGNIGALVVAAVSFGLTVGLILGFQQLTGFNLFSLMWWVVVPIGAFATGVLAASGYYLGAVKIHVKATAAVAVELVVVAALVQVSLYYGQYALAVTEDGYAVRDLVGFLDFVAWKLSHARYGVISHGVTLGDADVGVLGYVIAGVQFLALAAAGLVVFAALQGRPYCDGCRRYLTSIAKRQIPFAGDEAALALLRTAEASSPAYIEHVRRLPAGDVAALELELSRCPRCGAEAIDELPMFPDGGKLSYRHSAHRRTWAAPGASLAPELEGLGSST